MASLDRAPGSQMRWRLALVCVVSIGAGACVLWRPAATYASAGEGRAPATTAAEASVEASIDADAVLEASDAAAFDDHDLEPIAKNAGEAAVGAQLPDVVMTMAHDVSIRAVRIAPQQEWTQRAYSDHGLGGALDVVCESFPAKVSASVVDAHGVTHRAVVGANGHALVPQREMHGIFEVRLKNTGKEGARCDVLIRARVLGP